MRKHFHNVARQSPARTAVRDLQDQALANKQGRTSGMILHRRFGGTHVQPDLEMSRQRSAAPSVSGVPLWG